MAESIIPEKFRQGYKGAQDWVSEFITGQVAVQKFKTVETEGGGEEQRPVGKPKTDLDHLFELAEKNGLKANELYGDQVDRPGAVGRLRMTIGNTLRKYARQRHGLYNRAGDWCEADAEFLADAGDPTHTRDGGKIAPPKAKAEAEAAEEGAAA